jgi:DNA (cytosine-5)-methyltransferase 3A
LRVLSLFDGMSCGMIAMRNAGIEVDSYDAYEIDKYAIQVSKHNFPMIKQHGDVFKGDFAQFESVDWVIGGSPCTHWSIAQKNNRETTASGIGWELFQQYVRAIKEAKPKYFLYENNKSMSKEIRASITEAFGFEPVLINSALVSAQNRQRLYWVGKRNDDGTYSKVDVEQPKDKGILLRDVLDNAVAWQEKSYALTTAITTVQKDNAVCEPIRIGCLPSPDGTIKKSQAMRLYSVDGKAVNQTANGGGMGAKTGLYAVPVNAISEADGKTYPIYEVKDGQITIKGKQYPIKLADGYYIIRKLTVNECKRLQTVPDWYDFSVISNSQAYKCLGNGWTCDVITHLIKSALNQKTSQA